MMYELRVKAHFAAAHRLLWHPKCRQLHGHTYHIEVVLSASKLNENGVVVEGFSIDTVTLAGDVLSVQITVSPTPGINFALNTVVLVPASISA